MPTGSGLLLAGAAAALLGLGWLAGYPELVAAGFACLAALLVAALWMLLRPDLAAVRDVRPQRVSPGEEAFGVLTLTNEAHRRSPPILAAESVAGFRIQVPI